VPPVLPTVYNSRISCDFLSNLWEYSADIQPVHNLLQRRIALANMWHYSSNGLSLTSSVQIRRELLSLAIDDERILELCEE
jgi:hypothetical protein